MPAGMFVVVGRVSKPAERFTQHAVPGITAAAAKLRPTGKRHNQTPMLCNTVVLDLDQV
jgi:hypothetical protein